MAFIVEAIAIDDGAVFYQAEGARARIAGLRARRQRADFDEAEAEAEHRVGNFGVFIEARRKADWIWKIEAESGDGQARVVLRRRARRQKFQRGDGRAMRALGVEQTQQRRCERECVDHVTSPENSCRPSAANGSGSTRATASSGSAP